jgi:hypothetical protein
LMDRRALYPQSPGGINAQRSGVDFARTESNLAAQRRMPIRAQ